MSETETVILTVQLTKGQQFYWKNKVRHYFSKGIYRKFKEVLYIQF